MGLDITAYNNLIFSGPIDAEDIEGELLYTAEGCDDRLGMPEGYYDESDGERHGFRAGSYSGYNRWRNTLCEAALGVTAQTLWDNTAAFERKPFYELINYSDCEGAFGPTASAKLAADFRENRELVFKNLERLGQFDSDFCAKYDDWLAGFELAANGGALILH